MKFFLFYLFFITFSFAIEKATPVIFVSENNSFEVLEYQVFSPSVLSENGDIINKDKYSQEKFDW
ncbi:MAG: hypothetical protein ACRC37_01785, partial [Lentisphaeria bacterium]